MGESQLFVVRVWPRPAGSFFASVRRVDQEDTRNFCAAEQLARFLSAAVQATDRPGEPALPPAPTQPQP